MATVYFDLPNAVNGTGTSASPKNATGWAAYTPVAGDILLFKRATTSAAAAFTLTAGTSGNVIKWGAWANADGSDNTALACPILTTTTVLSSVNSTNKDYVWLDNIEVKSSGYVAANDKAVIYLGDGSTMTNCIIDSTCGAVAVYGKSNVTITDNTLYGVSHSSANNNCVLIVSDTPNMDSISILRNTIKHYGGGGTTSHCVRLECTSSANALTNLAFKNNTLIPSTGVLCANLNAIGLLCSRCPTANIDFNVISFFLEGIFFHGGGASTMCYIRYNTCQHNSHYGIHLGTNAIGCVIDGNTCSYNGTSTYDGVTLFAYGRGIECSSAAGQALCSAHTIRFNTCNNNFNYGGPLDNATEGVGIGLDDSTYGCTVYANTCANNEGNGIQCYGGTLGSGTPAITDTGGHNIYSNLLDTNCTAAYKNRRSGGTDTNLVNAHIGMSIIAGTTGYVAHNVFTGATKVGISTNSACDDLIFANNIFYNVAYPISLNHSASAGVCTNNDFLSATTRYSTNSANLSGSATYVPHSTFVGTNDFTFDPLLDSTYVPNGASPAISAGVALPITTKDFLGRAFNPTPTLGMWELSSSVLGFRVPGGRIRRAITHKH